MVRKSRDGGAHGDPGHAPGPLVAGAAQHHETEGREGSLRGCGHATVAVSDDGCQGEHHSESDLKNGSNWFYRNVHDPAVHGDPGDPWQLLYAAWEQLSFEFSAVSGFADYQAVVGADLLNEPYIAYVGGSPSAGQSVLEAAGTGSTPSTTRSPRRSRPTTRVGCCCSRTARAGTTRESGLAGDSDHHGQAISAGELGLLTSPVQLALRNVLRRRAPDMTTSA